MPVTQAEVLHIVCDNPSCPGNDLDPKERTGWTFITAEVYPLPAGSFVYCCSACSASVSARVDELAEQPLVPPPPEGEQPPPLEPPMV